jgi:hypothetical protein
MSIKQVLFTIRAVCMTVSVAGTLATVIGGIAMTIASFAMWHFFGGDQLINNNFADKVAIGYVGFPVFLVFFIWGLFKVPGFLRRSGLI